MKNRSPDYFSPPKDLSSFGYPLVALHLSISSSNETTPLAILFSSLSQSIVAFDLRIFLVNIFWIEYHSYHYRYRSNHCSKLRLIIISFVSHDIEVNFRRTRGRRAYEKNESTRERNCTRKRKKKKMKHLGPTSLRILVHTIRLN